MSTGWNEKRRSRPQQQATYVVLPLRQTAGNDSSSDGGGAVAAAAAICHGCPDVRLMIHVMLADWVRLQRNGVGSSCCCWFGSDAQLKGIWRARAHLIILPKGGQGARLCVCLVKRCSQLAKMLNIYLLEQVALFKLGVEGKLCLSASSSRLQSSRHNRERKKMEEGRRCAFGRITFDKMHRWKKGCWITCVLSMECAGWSRWTGRGTLKGQEKSVLKKEQLGELVLGSVFSCFCLAKSFSPYSLMCSASPTLSFHV